MGIMRRLRTSNECVKRTTPSKAGRIFWQPHCKKSSRLLIACKNNKHLNDKMSQLKLKEEFAVVFNSRFYKEERKIVKLIFFACLKVSDN